MAIQICAVTGTIRDYTGTGIGGVTVSAYAERPFIHPTDNSLIVNYQITTTTASNGTWTLNLVETTTPNTTLTISFVYPIGSNSLNTRQEYTIQVPNSASATFQSLIGTQV